MTLKVTATLVVKEERGHCEVKERDESIHSGIVTKAGHSVQSWMYRGDWLIGIELKEVCVSQVNSLPCANGSALPELNRCDTIVNSSQPNKTSLPVGPKSQPHNNNIAIGLASVLAYLHQECEQEVIHRDIKTSNIMLDGNFGPRLGDFGLTRSMDHDKSPVSTLTAACRLELIVLRGLGLGEFFRSLTMRRIP
ncbi:hypothetical protein F3Y22_tig00110458pilonHSYRG00453 [Hibiscus syriacus]|uniref:Protein kinase domain-containing protein n=1 Tax=Hibiscus syriacus TaxID=106335 RepID=A0A6A3ALL9_HIBSY|nr:hypothetical protein F3Y22_tig00110458pilonHSYRG00453 [Hibiscus syriacus]